MSCSSKANPIQLIWSNNTLTPDGKTVTSGVVVSVGTPPQQLALTPEFNLNNSFINNIATCGSNSNSSCISIIGGGFNPSLSSTYTASSADSWNGSSEDVADLLLNKGYGYLNDEVQIASQKIPAVPLLLQPTGTLQYGGLGLGQDSPFLKELVSSGKIPSRSFSLYTGLYSQSQSGLLMLGGYSDRFYTGQLYQHQADGSCTACVNVTGLTYQLGNKTVDLLGNRTSHFFEAIVDPFYPGIGLPTDVAYAFSNATGGTPVGNAGLKAFPRGKEPNASLVVTLNSGLVTTIPHEALFTPPGYTNGVFQTSGGQDNETYTLVQPWSVISQADSSTSPNLNAGWFGIPFAAFVYIIRDYERQTLQIAAANQAAIIQGNATAICSTNATETGSGSGSSSHAGAIAGGVIGGVVVLALIAFAIWFFLRRSKRSKAASKEGTGTSQDPNLKSELPASTSVVSPITPATAAASQKPDMAVVQEAPTHEKQELPAAVEKNELPADKTTQVEELASDSSTAVEEMPTHKKIERVELPA